MSLPWDHMPEYAEIVVQADVVVDPVTSSPSLHIVLLGLITEDPSLYRPHQAFGGHVTILPILERTQEWIQHFQQQQRDHDSPQATTTTTMIIPLTHQSISHDRHLARTIGAVCPLICGGHDHDIYHETIPLDNHHHQTCQIVKAGMDAQHAAIIDIVWNRSDETTKHHPTTTTNTGGSWTTTPTIQVQMVSTLSYEPDPMVQQRVLQHQQILQELEQAKLFRVADWARPVETVSDPTALSFSTVNNRIQPSTGTTTLCTMIQMGLRTQLCILNAGAVRGNTDYPTAEDSYFTWAHLKNEIPFRTDMCVVTIPGRVIEAMIHHSRLGSYQTPPVASGGYLHTCANVKFHHHHQDHDDQHDTVVNTSDATRTSTIRPPPPLLRIRSILGDDVDTPFDPDRGYLTALPKQFLDGIDNHVPLLEWAASPSNHVVMNDETCVPAKLVLVQVLAATMWLQMGQFHDLDLNQDGMISRDEIRQRLIQLNDGKCEHVADLMVDNLLSICDLNEDGVISPIEMMVCQYVATDMLKHVGTRDEIRTMTNIVRNVLGQEDPPTNVSRLVERLRQMMDVHGDGHINRQELSEIFKGTIQRGNDFLQ